MEGCCIMAVVRGVLLESRRVVIGFWEAPVAPSATISHSVIIPS